MICTAALDIFIALGAGSERRGPLSGPPQRDGLHTLGEDSRPVLYRKNIIQPNLIYTNIEIPIKLNLHEY